MLMIKPEHVLNFRTANPTLEAFFAQNGGIRRIDEIPDIYQAAKKIADKVMYRGHWAGEYHSLKRFPQEEQAMNDLLMELSKKILRFFHEEGTASPNNQESFDHWFYATCEWLLDEINTIRNRAGYENATFGNAQKLLNVLLKYLASFTDYPQYADLFSYCHFPIDSNILRALREVGVPNIVYRKTEEVAGLHPKGGEFYVYNETLYPWNGFTEPAYKQLVADYRENAALIKRPECTFLGAEYAAWGPTRADFRRSLTISDGDQAPRIEFFHE